jgi:hypothetical protein
MTNSNKTKSLIKLPQLLENSNGFHFLIPTYQQTLENLAKNGDLSLRKTLDAILRHENPADLQSAYFTEQLLQDFVERNLKPIDASILINEYRIKAKNLIETFICFSLEEKANIISSLNSLNLNALKELINLYKFGHHKQDQYLQMFAEKDPKQLIKFRLISKKLTKK